MSAVLRSVSDGVGIITLNRPSALNAINAEIRKQLPIVLAEFESDPAIKVIVIRGEGDRAFCVGADIKEFAPVESLDAYRNARARNNWVSAFDRVTKPIIAALHGYCLGGGLEIALACDIRIASCDSVFAFPETSLGIIPGAGGTQRIARIIGFGRALDMVLTGEKIKAQRALEIGLITRLVDVGQVGSVAEKLATDLSTMSVNALAYAKEAIVASCNLPLTTGLLKEVELLTLLMNSEGRLTSANNFRQD